MRPASGGASRGRPELSPAPFGGGRSFPAGAELPGEEPQVVLSGPPVSRYELASLMHRFTSDLRRGFAKHLGVAPERGTGTRAATGKGGPGGYPDVPRDHWAAGAIGWLVEGGLIASGGGRKFEGAKPATRFEFALVLGNFIRELRPGFVRAPRQKWINEAKIRGLAGDVSRAAMLRLAREGFLPYGSPIFEGPADAIHPQAMAVALSQSARRIAERFRAEDSR